MADKVRRDDGRSAGIEIAGRRYETPLQMGQALGAKAGICERTDADGDIQAAIDRGFQSRDAEIDLGMLLGDLS